MQGKELLILLRHLAVVQQRIDRQLRAQQQEIEQLRHALMQSRASLIIDLTRRHWLAQAAPLPIPQDTTLPNASSAPTAVLGSLRQKLRTADLITRKAVSALATEVVICQSGCLSHDAYWRVQEYCRRNGKHCLLIDAEEVESLLATHYLSPP